MYQTIQSLNEPANTTSSVAYQLPAADNSSNTHLTTNVLIVLSCTASLSLANDSNNRVVTNDIEINLTLALNAIKYHQT